MSKEKFDLFTPKDRVIRVPNRKRKGWMKKQIQNRITVFFNHTIPQGAKERARRLRQGLVSPPLPPCNLALGCDNSFKSGCQAGDNEKNHCFIPFFRTPQSPPIETV
jgi:hypothetical protein